MSAFSVRRGVAIRVGPDAWIVAAIAATWGLAVVAQARGERSWLHQHDIGGVPDPGTLATFFGAWTAMVVAMMLPTTLPFLRLYFRIAEPQSRRELVRGALVASYLVAWLLFGVAALGFDIAVREAAGAWTWLGERPWLVPGATLVLAGAFQFTDLKTKCLTECRHPAAYLLRRYRRGAGAAFTIGFAHARFCVGCCWALMLLMVAVGVSNLIWMAFLAGIMLTERTLPGGDRIVRPLGAALIAVGVLVLVQPAWLPGDLSFLPNGDDSFLWWCA